MIWTRDWSDERYVRLFVRNTVTWVKLMFCGQTTLMHLLRQCNRVGLIPLSGEDLENVVALIGHPEQWEGCWKPGLAKLLEFDVVRVVGEGADTCLWVVKFLEAQETVASDKQRQKEKRARDRDKLLALKAGLPVTVRDAMSRNVTPPSRRVMKPSRRAVPSPAVPSCASPSGDAAGAARVEQPVQPCLVEVPAAARAEQPPGEEAPPKAPRKERKRAAKQPEASAGGAGAPESVAPSWEQQEEAMELRSMFAVVDEVHRECHRGAPHPWLANDVDRGRVGQQLQRVRGIGHQEGLRGQSLVNEFRTRLRRCYQHPTLRRDLLPAFVDLWASYASEPGPRLSVVKPTAPVPVTGNEPARAQYVRGLP